MTSSYFRVFIGSAVLVATGLVCPTLNGAAAQGIGAGPVIGYAWGHGASLCWEIGAFAGPETTELLLHLSVGGSYRPDVDDSAPQALHYVAWEPWFVVGATAGVAVDSRGAASPMLGLWEGLPVGFGATWFATVALGLRWLGGAPEIYLTPKIWRASVNFDL